jgi:hypothetical protein
MATDIFPTSNMQPDQGRGFINSILSRLPYVKNTVETGTNNPRYELFDRLSKRQEYRVLQQSVITGPFLTQNNDIYNPNTFASDQGYHRYIYANIDSDKIRRLAEYRRIAAFAEVSDCLDEICDEFISKDDEGKIIKLSFNGFEKLNPEERKEIEKEFYKFINIFDLPDKGWGYCRQMLTEGEIFFENVVSERKEDLGVIGVLNVPGELINPIYDNVQNNVIQNFVFQKPINLLQQQNQQPQTQKDGQYPNIPSTPNPINNNLTPNNVLQHQVVTLQGNQVTYINSGLWNEDMTIRIPFIENCRRAYKQLSLLEDAIVIYRLVRAPERLKFVIDVGNMPPAKAEAYIRQLMQKYWTKKTYDTQSGGAAGNIYDPQSMLDSFWFAKRAGEQGSNVEVLQGGQNLGQLDDLNYFVLKLYKSLKVPTTRLNPNESFKDGSEILREELRFAKFIIRLQNQFAQGLKNSFVTHLKLRGWWKQYKLHESYFDLSFNPPSNFFAIRQQNLFELKYKNFNDMSGNDGISNTFAQRHYLGLNDAKISENMEWKRKDAALNWELQQIQSLGPNWREQLEVAETAMKAGGLGAGKESPIGGGGSSSPTEIPEFGGGETPPAEEAPAALETTPETETSPALEATPETPV